MRTDTVQTILRDDYQPYPYQFHTVALNFDLDATKTRVHSVYNIESTSDTPQALLLDGDELELESVLIDGQTVDQSKWKLDNGTLTLFPDKKHFVLEIVNYCRPAENSSLMGLYVSGNSLLSQCEAQGFRRITWFPDRPDVMSRYTVTLRACKKRYPYLLSNGNLIETRNLDDGRHLAVWEDPHPKPSYLFAIVAGDFDCREHHYEFDSGQKALLQIYSDKGCYAQTEWAMACLIRAIEWDRSRFGLNLDLNRFMIVATRDFNMGAMENKGLNIFNASYILASPDTATDSTYQTIEAVIGHEYFHNWTGNRVTCRDWFQLSLKEGLTVFREQEFSADMQARGLSAQEAITARAVKRIDDVITLRTQQFPEDAGPMAHPIRPDSYQEISNFYTATIYEKGAEVIRMLHTILGDQTFLDGLHDYFRQFDGQAVTCDDFITVMEKAYQNPYPSRNLNAFRRWYEQAGTPQVDVDINYCADTQRCSITLKQHNAPVGLEKPGKKPPLHIPFALGLLSQDGHSYAINTEANNTTPYTAVLQLQDEQQQWQFDSISSTPIVSLLRGFSAPVKVNFKRSFAEWTFLARHDPDPFARWEAAQELLIEQLTLLIKARTETSLPSSHHSLVDTWYEILQDDSISPAYQVRLLTMPTDAVLLDRFKVADPVATRKALQQLEISLGQSLADSFLKLYETSRNDTAGTYQIDPHSVGQRARKALALRYLMAANHTDALSLAQQQYQQANNLSDRLSALAAIIQYQPQAAGNLLGDFYEQWQHSAEVIDRWFALQAQAPSSSADEIRGLMLHPAFTLRNPNRARALIFQFCQNNPLGIHTSKGYQFWEEQVLALDKLNPEIAARLARIFDNWQRYDSMYAQPLKEAYARIRTHEGLSPNVKEIAEKALNQ